MKIFPAIDIINGECVRLTKGLAENKTIYDKSPVEMAKIYQDKGFETIHVVDLDATLGKGSNDKTLELIRKNIDIKIEVAGGIRDKASIQNKINQGFDIIVIGTFAIKGIDKVSKLENNILEKISVAIDLKDNKIASHGWQQTSTDSLESIVNIYNELPIHSFFVTDVANDGMLSGLNFSTFESIQKLTDKKITIGGGVKDLSDVQIGIKNGFDHMVIGKAIYENKFSLDELVKLNA
ncbi:MAG: HisA/HisF-related TIM barrel protein [Alphaproteobacteria bacterium]|tara:strand:+ start:19 stop:729 length:711 start_codon:yes stop_codon:yes gene_type:complete